MALRRGAASFLGQITASASSVAHSSRPAALVPTLAKARRASSTQGVSEDDGEHAPPLNLYDLAGKYATALWRVASRSEQLEQVTSELTSMKDMLSSSKNFRALVEDPTVSSSKKITGVREILNELDASQVMSNFMTVLVENGRLSQLENVVEQWEELLSAQRGELTATVRSAEPLDEEDVQRLRSAILTWVGENKSLNIETVTDRSLLGGFVVNFGDQQLDMSLESRVQRYQSILSQSL